MSGTSGERLFATDAVEIAERAADWIARRNFSSWSEQDQAELDAWLAQSLSHEIAYMRMEAGWNKTERLTALRQPAERPGASAATRKPLPFLLRFAVALIAIAVLAGAGALYLFNAVKQDYATPVGGHQVIALVDGSKIELNTDTIIRTSFSASSREVRLLKGEAYFQVKHDSTRPFVVMVAQHRVTDLGTKFFVRDSEGSVQVALIEGSAELKSDDGAIQQHSVVLTPGDVAVASAHSLSVSRKPERELNNELGWRRGVIVFSHTSLADAAAEFNRYNTTKLVIADEKAGERIIGATLPVHDVSAFADVAHEVFGLHIEKRGNAIVISR
jgi:transmembrane sensor